MKKNITFSQKVKNEILSAEKTTAACCQRAYLSAVVRGAGSLAIGSQGLGFEIVSGNIELLKFVNQIVRRLVDKQPDITAENALGKTLYSTECYDTSLMYDIGIVCEEGGLVSISGSIEKFAADACCRKCFIKGMFLACGSITVSGIGGTGANYHMEFQLSDEDIAEQFAGLLAGEGFPFKTAKRGSKSMVYLKDKDIISDMVVYLGASASRLEMENILMLREIRNNANRQSNCTTANIDRHLDASEKQIRAITKLIERGLLGQLDKKLKEAADLRMENPEIPMEQLADLMGISKSGANHRMRRLIELAGDTEDE